MDRYQKEKITRRAFVAGGAAVLVGAVVGFVDVAVKEPGDSSRTHLYFEVHDDDEHSEGFSTDTETCTYPVKLRVVADEYVRRCWTKGNGDSWDELLASYRRVDSRRANVSAEIEFASSEEISRMCEQGCSADIVIGDEDAIRAGLASGVLYGGIARTSVRDIGCWSEGKMQVVRAKGSDAHMPTAIDGEEVPDPDEMNLLELLPWFEGTFGICAEGTYQGRGARSTLYQAGLYSEPSGEGGSFDERLDGIVVEYADDEELCGALENGECDLGMLNMYDLLWYGRKDGGEAHDVEEAYSPSQNDARLSFKGCSVEGSEESGVARDLLQFMHETS